MCFFFTLKSPLRGTSVAGCPPQMDNSKTFFERGLNFQLSVFSSNPYFALASRKPLNGSLSLSWGQGSTLAYPALKIEIWPHTELFRGYPQNSPVFVFYCSDQQEPPPEEANSLALCKNEKKPFVSSLLEQRKKTRLAHFYTELPRLKSLFSQSLIYFKSNILH